MIILSNDRKQELLDLGLATFQGDRIHYIFPDYTDIISDPEEQVRADLYLDLIQKFGYAHSSAIELEKLNKIGHPLKKTDAKIDILVKFQDGKPFMVIETKSPNDYEEFMETSIRTQLFNVAAVENQEFSSIKYLVYTTRYYENNRLVEKTVCIDYKKYPSFESWEENNRPNLRTIPSEYGIVRVSRFIKGAETDLRTEVGRDELQRIRKNLHNILWGGGKYQNELFYNLVGLFLVKIYDEKETIEGEPYKFQIFFEDNEPEESKKVYKRINDLYFNALQEYLGYSKEELRKVKDIAFDVQKVRYVVDVLQSISFTTNRFDVIGDFFEGIVRGEFKQSKGQYLTHTNLIKFMVAGLDLGSLVINLINEEKRLPYIIDPSCGSGAFLIESMAHITDFVSENLDKIRKSQSVQEFVNSSFPIYRKNAWAKDNIYGIEINGDLAVSTKVNMVGHGDGSANIDAKDALLPFQDFDLGLLQITKNSEYYEKPVNEQFDIILSNPPFSVTVDRDSAKTFPSSYIQGDNIWQRIQKSNEQEISTELLFIERYYQLLRPGGRMAVVLPESVFDTSSTRDIRLFLLKFFKLVGIISINSEAFAPYTTTKTNILFAEKKNEREVQLWNDAWEKYSSEYDELIKNISIYISNPPLHKKLLEIADRYEAETQTWFDNYFKNSFADTIIDNIMENKIDENLLDRVIKEIHDQLDPENKNDEIITGIIKRKQTFIPSFNNLVNLVRNKNEFIGLLQKLLGSFFDEAHRSFSLDELINEYSEEIRYADKNWWVYKNVSKDTSNYSIFLSHAEEIGYKRGVRGEEDRPNELFSLTTTGEIDLDFEHPDTILEEFLRTNPWSK